VTEGRPRVFDTAQHSSSSSGGVRSARRSPFNSRRPQCLRGAARAAHSRWLLGIADAATENGDLEVTGHAVLTHARDAATLSYRIIRLLVRALVALFYRRIDVVGLEHIPARGPLIVAANHQNALVDPMLLLAAIPRRLIPVSKASLFRHPLIAPFLRIVGAIPVQRRLDPGSDPSRNVEAFRAVTGALARGQAILIFPEGVSQPEPTLMVLKTGTARMVLSVEAPAGREEARLLPIGLSFHDPGTFRAGTAYISVGPPVETVDCHALYARDPEHAVRRLTHRLANALTHQIVDAEDRETLALLKTIEAVWRAESGDGAPDPTARTRWLQRATRAYRYLRVHAPAAVRGFRRDVECYASDLAAAGISPRHVSQEYSASTVSRYALREGLPLLLGLPIAAVGMALHLAPYHVTRLAVRALRPEADTQATYKIAAGVVLYPLVWIIEGLVIRRVAGTGALMLFLAALAPTGFFALSWGARLARVRQETRGFVQFLIGRDLRRRLVLRRRALIAEMERLAAQVPEAVLAEQSPHDKIP
jgi:glycerol-3-phosphate O-acyltransferase / dihydroxyacetone phosphate acyltransferase